MEKSALNSSKSSFSWKKYLLLSATVSLVTSLSVATSYAVETQPTQQTEQTSQVNTSQTAQTTQTAQTSQMNTSQTAQTTQTAQTSQGNTSQTAQTTQTAQTSQGNTSQTAQTTQTAQTSQGNTSQTAQTTQTTPTTEPAVTPVFSDVTGHWAASYINQLKADGIVSGRTATTFEPDATLTRAEMVKIALLAFNYQVKNGETPGFTDVASNSWYAKYVAAAETAGIVGGYSDNTFRPDAEVTRSEALKILLLAAKVSSTQLAVAPATSFMDVISGEWYAGYVNYAFSHSIVTGKDSTHFAPADNVTRGEMAKMTVKAMEM